MRSASWACSISLLAVPKRRVFFRSQSTNQSSVYVIAMHAHTCGSARVHIVCIYMCVCMHIKNRLALSLIWVSIISIMHADVNLRDDPSPSPPTLSPRIDPCPRKGRKKPKTKTENKKQIQIANRPKQSLPALLNRTPPPFPPPCSLLSLTYKEEEKMLLLLYLNEILCPPTSSCSPTPRVLSGFRCGKKKLRSSYEASLTHS